MNNEWTIARGPALNELRKLDPGAARCCVTSPPYWRVRDYGHPEQLGQEPTPELYVSALVEVLDEIGRVLADDGTLWLNLGDSYVSQGGGSDGYQAGLDRQRDQHRAASKDCGLPRKSLLGMPWRVALALQQRGWVLRSDIVWHKPNAMPESVKDRPSSAHEHLFLLARSQNYFYAGDTIAEAAVGSSNATKTRQYADETDQRPNNHRGVGIVWNKNAETRNARDVWVVPTAPFKGPHFAVMPLEIARRCVLAGSVAGDLVIDPFAGVGTTGLAALRNGRRFWGAELVAETVELARRRIEADAPLFNRTTGVA